MQNDLPAGADPQWLTWGRELQAIAQTGLAFTRDPYDVERYEMLRALASRIMAEHSGASADRIEALFAAQDGYATPKVDVRTAVFDEQGRMLLVREVVDAGRWTLPGGWADVNLTLAESAAKEVREESGYEARILKLAAVWDRTKQGHPSHAFSCAKVFFVAALTGGVATTSLETAGTGWFHEHELPEDLSLGRVLPGQLARMFLHRRDMARSADFD